MKKKLNLEALKGLSPAEKPYEIFDTELRNLLLRVEPSGTLTYYCAFRLKLTGKRGRYLLGKHPVVTPAGAREQAKIVLGDVARGIDPMAVVREQRRLEQRQTLESFLDGPYAAWTETHYSNPKQIIKRLKGRFRGQLGEKMDELSPFAFEKWKASRLATKSRGKFPKANTVNRDMADLRAALNRAVTWGFLKENPLSRVKAAAGADDPIVRYLSDAEELSLRKSLNEREELLRVRRDNHNEWLKERHMPLVSSLREVVFADHLKPMVLVSINTGLRRGELFKLQWKDVNLGANPSLKVTAATAKSKKPRHVPINTEARDLLKAWRAQTPLDMTFVFTSPTGTRFDNVNKSWKGLLKAAQITKFRWHDLRHHFASRLVMNGVDLNTVRELMGHADLKMTLRYAHLAPEHKALAVEKIVRAA